MSYLIRRENGWLDMFINPGHGLSFKTINGKAGILLAGALLSILFLSSMASAAVTTYYWTPSTDAIGSSGFTANWGSCGAQPTSYKVTTLSNAGFTCNNDELTNTSRGDQFLAILPTAYGMNTQIKGQSGATFYLEERTGKRSVTYRFDLGYAKNGVFTSLGYVTQTVPKGTSNSYSINMSGISGTAPSGSSVALRVSVTSTSGEQRIYLGKDGGRNGSNSGRFYVDEMPAVTPTPAPMYPLSGYVTNASTGAAISGATVTTNTSLTTTTNTRGYYNFTPSNGTYLITASKAGYSDNSTTVTISGADSLNNNISLSPFTGGPQLIVFTDRQVYTDGAYNGQKKVPQVSANQGDNAPYNLTVYAILLDDEGNIINSEITFQAYYNTTAILDHVNESETPFNSTYADTHHIIKSGDLFNGTFSSFSETLNSGVFYSIHAPLDIPDNKYPDEHFMINITVKATYNSQTLVSNYTVMLTRLSCHNNAGIPTDEKYSHNSQHNNKPDTCAICHHGYEHMYENISEGIPNSFRSSHFGKLVSTNPTTSSPQASTYFWNLSFSTATTIYSSYTPSSYQWGTWAPGSQYCYDCHYDTTDGTYGGATSPDYIDMQSASGDRVSCSWSQSPSGATCHNTTKMEKNSTASLVWKYIANSGGIPTTEQAVQSRSHNISNVSKGMTCKLCHRDYHSNLMPNAAASRTDITEQCYICHSSTGPKTSPKFAHSSTTTNCKACHYNAAGKLDAHLVPTATAGGRNCTLCHNVGGSATGMLVNFTSVNKSMHANLNKNATGNATNKPCWACHGTKNGTYANETDQPASSHNETVYKNPRKCYDCHNDTSPLFTAKNVTDHIPSGLSTNTDVNTSSYNNTYCSYCHNNSVGTSLDPDGLGLTGGSPRNASSAHYGANKTKGKLMNATSNSTDCNYCHKNSSNMLVWGVLQGSLANISNKNATGGGTNHNSYTASSQCASCHGGYTVTAGFTFHNAQLGSGSAGGRNCTLCHNVGGSAGTGRLVNFSAMNNTNAIHRNLNSGAITSLPAENKKCWACHGNGSEPGNKHPSNYRTPYGCEDCHVQIADQNLNFTPKAILNVSQHYWNGTNISTRVTSCDYCHNRTEMLVGTNLDPDGALASNNSGHYGKKRTDMAALAGTNSYCDYCHNTSTNNITFSIGDYNNSITNHSNLPTTPLCAYCHNTGRIHDYQLEKPVSSDVLCKNCHGVSGPASLRNKSEHKALYCTECHANATNGSLAGRDIHGIKFIQKDNTFSQNRTNAVDCTTCHQSNAVDNSLGTFTPPRVNSPLHHSTNLSNGSIWGNYWTTPFGACIFCHADTKHNLTPLGRPLGWNSSYAMNTTIGSGTNCADCHYRGDSNYDTMDSTFTAAGLPKPPEITNGSWQGRPGYYNHSFNKYTDSQCKGCHDTSASTTVGQLIHNVAVGQSGGRDCVLCHTQGGSAPDIVNITAMNQTGAVHKNLNKVATATLDSDNKRCWACHTNTTPSADNVVNENELPSAGHPDSYKNPKTCTGCHQNLSGNMNAKQVYAHMPDAAPSGINKPVNTTFSCVMCHNNSKLNEPQKTLEAVISHYATRTNLVAGGGANVDQTYCRTCHQNLSTGQNYGIIRLTNNHNLVSSCLDCHRSGNTATSLHDSNIIKPAFFYNSESDNYCSGCHSIGSGNGWGAPHGNANSFVSCTNCHMNYTTNVSRMTYVNGARLTSTVFHTNNGTPSYSYNGLAPGNNSYPYGSIEYNRSRCTVCHDRGIEHNNDSDCTTCHKGVDVATVNGNTFTRPVFHSQNITGGGGPDCIACHDKASTGAVHKIDVNAAAGLGIHANLNAQAVNSSDVPAGNKKCWGCHQSDGKQPTGMGDIYKNPYSCLDCHGNDSKLSAMSVEEHYVNGTDVKAVKFAPDNLSSCIFCHNKSEMKVDYQEVDDLWSNISLISHYGKKRIDIFLPPNSTDCKYCHQNTSTNFIDAFNNVNNTNVTHNGAGPCSDCHGFGRLHNSTLSLGNCLVCHGAGGTSAKKNISGTDLGKHINLSSLRGADGGGVIDVEDCRTCHFGSPHKSSKNPAGVSKANTYYCESCHFGSNNRWSISSTIQLSKFKHGLTDCASCHTANYSTERLTRAKNYHVGDPRGAVLRGAVFNPEPWMPNYGTYATCFDCHNSYNGFDEPFHAPGMYRGRSGHLYDQNNCGGCHGDANGYVSTHYAAGAGLSTKSIIKSISAPANVAQSSPINISLNACYARSDGACDAFIQLELAQYRLLNTSTKYIVIDWTYMNATDGKFNSYVEDANATIDTNTLPRGNYTLEFRAMAGAHRSDGSRPYYPLNGMMSDVEKRYVEVI